jgi:hypothetical protein
LHLDIDNVTLEGILNRLVEERTKKEFSAAAQKISLLGPRAIEHITRQGRKAVARLLANIQYNATDTDGDVVDRHQLLLCHYVREELLRRYEKGVFSLAARANCPLMWSHYGDQHRGLCLGYSIPDEAAGDLHRVRYGGSRLVAASSIVKMLDGDDVSRHEVDDAVLLRKAKPWGYEREWRLIGPRGTHDSPLQLEEVVFGMRCTETVKYAVVKVLEPRDRPVKFYQIYPETDRFLLRKQNLDTEELLRGLPRRQRYYDTIFDDETEEGSPLPI